MKVSPHPFLFLILLTALFAAGCGSSPILPPEPQAAPPAGPTPPPAPTPAGPAGAETEATKQQAVASYGKISPFFTENQGQIDEAVKYFVKGPRGTVFFTATELVYDFLKERPVPEEEKTEEPEPGRPDRDQEKKREYDRLVFRRKFLDPNPAAQVAGQKELPGKVNYFIGDKSKWRPNVATFEEIAYVELYPGIDVGYHFEGNNLASAITVKPGGDPQRLRFSYEGADALKINEQGDLVIETAFGGFVEKAPRASQEIDGKKVEVPAKYVLSDDTVLTFDISPYDSTLPLVIE